MREKRGHGWRVVGPLLVLALTASCELVNTGEATCGGAEGLRPEHAALLACAGWEGFVRDHVCQIEYTLSIPVEKRGTNVLGRAFCGEGRILVATTGPRQGLQLPPLPPLEIATTIVHEATHLADACTNGEPPAVAAEQAFLADLCAAFAAGKEGCEAAQNYCDAAGSTP